MLKFKTSLRKAISLFVALISIHKIATNDYFRAIKIRMYHIRYSDYDD